MKNLENNRYYINRKDIAALAERNRFDADTASLVFARQMGWTDDLNELVEWRKAMRSAQLSKKGTLYDLFYG